MSRTQTLSYSQVFKISFAPTPESHSRPRHGDVDEVPSQKLEPERPLSTNTSRLSPTASVYDSLACQGSRDCLNKRAARKYRSRLALIPEECLNDFCDTSSAPSGPSSDLMRSETLARHREQRSAAQKLLQEYPYDNIDMDLDFYEGSTGGPLPPVSKVKPLPHDHKQLRPCPFVDSTTDEYENSPAVPEPFVDWPRLKPTSVGFTLRQMREGPSPYDFAGSEVVNTNELYKLTLERCAIRFKQAQRLEQFLRETNTAVYADPFQDETEKEAFEWSDERHGVELNEKKDDVKTEDEKTPGLDSDDETWYSAEKGGEEDWLEVDQEENSYAESRASKA